MAAIVEARVNRISLNRAADLFFEGQNVFVPFGSYAAKDVAGALRALGAETIVVDYRTVSDPQERERDKSKFTRRVKMLDSLYDRTDWAPRVISGFIHPDTMVCTLTRKR